jgi:hypothetical protein
MNKRTTWRRNPVARALRVAKPKVVRSRVKYTRKAKQKERAACR